MVSATIPDSLIACGISPKVAADTMIPAVKAIRISFHFSESFRINRIGIAPRTVAIADIKLPINAASICKNPFFISTLSLF
ncbi:hypothetical protein D3C71_1917980 [compost metagenome]